MKIDGDCPHCKKEVTLDTEKLQYVKQEDGNLVNTRVSAAGNNQILQVPEQKPSIVEKIKEVLPEFMPAGRCKNGNCDVGIHKNPNYKKRPKGKCTNCGQFSAHKEGDCPWCKNEDGKRGEIEELDDDELDELGIPKPPEDEHEGHSHE